MKKILLLLLLLSINVKSQFNFESSDSLDKNKSQIYSATKMFIATTWKSTADVIQNDDKENGLILVRAASIRKVYIMTAEYVYIYKYDVIFRMKDNKYKMTIDNVYCESAFMSNSPYHIVKIDPFEGDKCPETGTFKNPGITKKKAIPMMSDFKNELLAIIRGYEYEIKSVSNTGSDW